MMPILSSLVAPHVVVMTSDDIIGIMTTLGFNDVHVMTLDPSFCTEGPVQSDDLGGRQTEQVLLKSRSAT